MKDLLFAALLLSAVTVQAETYAFSPIHYAANEFAQNVGGQLFLEVTDSAEGSASLTFMNAGSFGSEIREIYFYTSNDLDPSATITLNSIMNGPGVLFDDGGRNGVNPSSLPAGSTLLPEYSVATAVDSRQGVAPGEYLTLTLDYAHPHHDLIDMLHSGELLVGIHAAKIQAVSSVSYLNVIPEPTSVLLIGLTASSYLFVRRRFAKTAA